MDEFIVVFVTASSQEEAQKISKALLEAKLIACANIISGVKSMFWWEGKIDNADELLLIIKAKKLNFDEIVKTVKANHSYQVPEIIALPIIDGNKEYLDWVEKPY